ncbi:MAG TPA: PAS domain S-box protein, partial [Cellvibrionaceae bacterium]
HESEARFRQLTDTITEVFWLTDYSKQTMLYVSPAYEKIWGRSCQNLMDNPTAWLQAIHPEDRPRVAAAAKLQSQGRYREIYRIARPDGELRWIEDKAFPVLDNHGQPYRIAGLATDITEFKQIENRLKRQERQLKQASRLAHFGAWTVDVVAKQIHLSDEVSHILELPEGEPLSMQQGLALYPPKWQPVVAQAVKNCINTGEAYDLEVQVATDSGRLRWVRIQGQAIREHTERVTRLEGSFQDVTEQKNIANLLRHGGGQRFQQLADALPFIIWSAIPDGSIDYANNHFSSYTGMAADATITLQKWLDVIHPSDRAASFCSWREAIQNHHDYATEFRLRCHTGDYHWHLAHATPIRDSNGVIIKWYGSAVDIDDRKKSEDKAQQFAERLAITLESITDAFFTLDKDWCFTYVNSEAEAVLKRPRQELLGNSLWQEFPESVSSEFEHHYRKALRENRKESFEAYYPSLAAWFSVNAYPSSEGLAVYFQDVTAHRQEQEQMRLLQTCVDHMKDIVLITEAEPQDEPGPRILYANPAFEQVTGYNLEEILGKSPRFLQGPKTQRHELDRVREAMQHWQPVRTELINYTKAGKEFWIEMELVPIANHKGWFTHWVAVERDITERKRINELEQANQVAALANEAKSHFLATVSHEIRTPINGVIGMVDVLHQTSLHGDQVEMVDVIRDSATSLLAIIEDILDISKIEAGKLELESLPLSLAMVLKKTCLLLDRLAENADVELTLYTDPALPAAVLGDELRLKQILINLTSNAIKFSSKCDRPGRVFVRAHVLSQNTEQVNVEFRIIDNGIGMNDDTLRRLFSPFVQADTSTSRHYGGTGLGLSITHNLVTMMDGDIKVSSTPDKGTEFRVRLWLPISSELPEEYESKPDVSGIHCMLFGNSPLLDDMARYLLTADAHVQQISHPEHFTIPDSLEAYVERVWVVDLGDHTPDLNALIQQLPVEDAGAVHWLILERGHRRQPRQEGEFIKIDANVLDEISFLKAIAIAAGRLRMPGVSDSEISHPSFSQESPSRLEALRQGRLILVAEDNMTNQNVIRRQLGLLGYAADIVNNGEEALTYWEKGEYALIITDLHMPVMDGYALVKTIREREAALPATAAIPVIALTANAQKSEADRCQQLGTNDYLTKPVSLSVLKATLAHWALPPLFQRSTPPLASVAAIVSEHLDVTVLAELVGGDSLTLREFLTDFKGDAERLGAAIGEALTAQDHHQLALLAHTLKSSSRAVGAITLADLCEQLELMARRENIEGVDTIQKRFTAVLSAVITEINRYLNEHH